MEILIILAVLNVILLTVILIKVSKKGNVSNELRDTRMEIMSGVTASIGTISESIKTSSQLQSSVIKTELEGIRGTAQGSLAGRLED